MSLSIIENLVAEMYGANAEILEYRLQQGEAEKAMASMKADGLNKDHVSIIKVLIRSRLTGRTQAGSIDFMKKNFKMKDVFALSDLGYLAFEPNPRNPRGAGMSYWLAPKGIVLGSGIRDGQITVEGSESMAEAMLNSSDLKRFFGGSAKKIQVTDRKGGRIALGKLKTLRDIDLIVQGFHSDGANAGIVRVHVDANGRLEKGFKSGSSLG